MKRFLTLLFGLVATSVGYSAPTYTSYFNNTHTYTNATVAGSVSSGSGVVTNALTAGTVTSTKAFRSYQGSLTHAGTVTLDFDATTTVNQISLTGAVTFALSNLATNRTYRLRINNPQATNCTVTLPSNTSTNFLGGAPTTITAGKVVMWSMEAWGSANADVISAWAETQ